MIREKKLGNLPPKGISFSRTILEEKPRLSITMLPDDDGPVDYSKAKCWEITFEPEPVLTRDPRSERLLKLAAKRF